MGYMGNHLATVSSAVFAVILTGLWPIMVDFAPVLDFVFIMAVPIMWFLVAICWVSQKSADYMKEFEARSVHDQKKSLSKVSNSTIQVYTSEGKHVSASEIKNAQSELTSDLEALRDSVKLKDSEIERLKQDIANLETLVQIESLKSELANLKMLAAEEKKTRRK